MAHPLDPKDDMQRMQLRKAEATAKGGHAFQPIMKTMCPLWRRFLVS